MAPLTHVKKDGITWPMDGAVMDNLECSDSIVHSGDTNTKIRFPAADTFTVETAGSERFRIDDSGRIGIGTNSPSSFSSGADDFVLNTSSGNCGLTLSTSAADQDNNIFFAEGTGANAVGRIKYAHADNSLQFHTVNTERLRISSTGNVGIGLTAPSSKLHIRTSTNHNLEVEESSGDIRISVLNDARDANEVLQFAASKFNFLTGKVGIGEDDPDGNTLLIRAASTVGTKNGHIMLTGDGADVGQGPQIVFSEAGAGDNWAGGYIGFARTGGGSVGNLVFGTRGSTGNIDTVPTERLRITSAGKVGIAQTNPNSKLGVTDAGSASDPVIQAHITGSNGGFLGFGLFSDVNSAYTWKVDNNGNVTQSGNLVVASGKGVDFSAHTHAGGMTSELLADYEEGTFTPSIAAVSAGWDSRTGTYIKVGNIVTVYIHLNTASGGSTNGDQVAITGLPFTSANNNGRAGATVAYHSGLITSDYDFPFLIVSSNGTAINFHKGNGNSFTGNDCNTSDFGLIVSAVYPAN